MIASCGVRDLRLHSCLHSILSRSGGSWQDNPKSLAVDSDAAGLIIVAGNGAGLIDARRRGAILAFG